MNLYEIIDQDLKKRFKSVVSIGWSLRNINSNDLAKRKELEIKQSRLNNYYSATKEVLEICFSHTTPSKKIQYSNIAESLFKTERKAVQDEQYELAHISLTYQKIINTYLKGGRR